jgi:hypothetical protein
MASTKDGGVVAVGTFDGALSVAGEVVAQGMDPNGFVVKLGDGGTHQWTGTFSSSTPDAAAAVVVDSMGHILVAGSAGPGVRIRGSGGEMILDPAGRDALVVELDPDGEVVWAHLFGGPGNDDGSGIDVLGWDGGRSIAIVGSMASEVDFGAGPVPHTGALDAFVLLIDGPSGCAFPTVVVDP